jgi:uncharacterized membrane protein
MVSLDNRTNSLSALLCRIFLALAGTVLFLTGAAKLITSFGNGEILNFKDPIFAIQFRYLFAVAGLVELAAARICFSSLDLRIRVGTVVWLTTNLVLYRLGLLLVHYHRPCHCLGNFTDILHLSPAVADTWLKAVLAFLTIGSYSLAFHCFRRRPDLGLV